MVDTGNSRVEKFTNDGVFLTTWGSYGTGDGQFITAFCVAVDSNGHVFVGNGDFVDLVPQIAQVEEFTNDGRFVNAWGSLGRSDGQFSLPLGVGVDASGNVYVTDYMNANMQKFTNSGTFIARFAGPGDRPGQFWFESSVAVDSTGNVFVADAWNHRIQEFTNTGEFITAWGSYGTGDGQFEFPYGVALDSAGDVFVADRNNNRIQKFTHTGVFVTAGGNYGSGNGQFIFPIGVAADSNGNVFVADVVNNRIQRFTDDGSFIATWGSYGTDDGQFNLPFGVAVDPLGNVFVADTYNSRIQKFTNDGAFVTKWGRPGAGIGQMQTPYGLAVDSDGNVFVSDTGDEGFEADRDNNRVEEFTNDGVFITTFGTYGLGRGRFNTPFGLAVDVNGNVFICDQLNDRIQEFAPCWKGAEGCEDHATGGVAEDGPTGHYSVSDKPDLRSSGVQHGIWWTAAPSAGPMGSLGRPPGLLRDLERHQP